MKQITNILLLMACTLTVLHAQQQPREQAIRITDFELQQEPGTVEIRFDMHIGAKAVERKANLTIIPLLLNGQDSIELQPVIVRGKRAQTLFERRFIASPATMATFTTGDAISAANGQSVGYTATLPYRPWMAGASLHLDGIYENCCTAVRTNIGIIAGGLMVPTEELYDDEKIIIPGRLLTTGEKLAEIFPFVNPIETYAPDGSKSKSVTIFFHVNKYDIDQDYRDNRQTLVDILSAVREITDSDDSNLEKIVIAGFASPEGGHALNRALSENRAKTVMRFIMDNSELAAVKFDAHTGGQDWEGLREMAAASDIPSKNAVLDILDNAPVWNEQTRTGRETMLRELDGGTPYAYMAEHIFPELRSAAYIKIYYSNK